MDNRIVEYLDLSYRRNVLGDHRVIPERALRRDPEYIAALTAELKRIRGLGAVNLASRDFVSYQHKRAIEAALAELERPKNVT